ncbi:MULTISPECIES: MurR/RpiR family transcriptional regulator [unclassified Paenibacillus]|uniref:MurR/RpiR family transcriptional regulator n=1 Tax=unclassified Paenibacillus TaxID=185978 RepID=UPI002404B3AF|nr:MULTISPECIES: MurR/RpiR family transcriptional regulator [unclassified Paenibacillus]MDF9839307.1 DNA-binding MurR/RpiR family transcriptional regulator [Paenibacillus sp. PastF-2]MDF9845888.1 DNA-binding MurR/RpiR family transcriptional regulator [Paenibacillus sp. PastM-2]MDF9852461.1 DNA-binding MurR/RpiR family transcriptional regulator [Paenibacillus sp. PastF-1]MDH6477809.1 DNA-binding MurR/RpiR family transcriptional regulator [Paenibacillus sp. PastH-2]MDH6505548.1 DNA-binding MurR/
MKLLRQLSEMPHFTTNEQSIAAYILHHRENMLQLNIQELAKATYTSHSAINRLTRKLGLSGFKEFTLQLAREFQQQTQIPSSVDPNYPFGYGETALQVAGEIAGLMKETVSRAYAYLDDEVLAQTAGMLDQAKRIFMYALGDSQIRARSFQNKLIKINKYAVIATELHEWAYHTVNLTPEDCAVFVTYHGNSAVYLKAARHLRQQGVPIITITAAGNSELAKLSTHCICVPDDEVKHAKIGTFSSQMAFEYVLNVIFSCIYKISYKHNKESAEQSLNSRYIKELMDGE